MSDVTRELLNQWWAALVHGSPYSASKDEVIQAKALLTEQFERRGWEPPEST